jgi:hypothetical protein
MGEEVAVPTMLSPIGHLGRVDLVVVLAAGGY